MKISSKDDLHRYVSSQLENYECIHYGYDDHEVFVDQVTEAVHEFLRCLCSWKYGDDMPDITEEEWRVLVDSVAITEDKDKLVHDFVDYSRTDDFSEVKEFYKLEIALNCVAFNDSLHEILTHAISLYESK